MTTITRRRSPLICAAHRTFTKKHEHIRNDDRNENEKTEEDRTRQHNQDDSWDQTKTKEEKEEEEKKKRRKKKPDTGTTLYSLLLPSAPLSSSNPDVRPSGVRGTTSLSYCHLPSAPKKLARLPLVLGAARLPCLAALAAARLARSSSSRRFSQVGQYQVPSGGSARCRQSRWNWKERER